MAISQQLLINKDARVIGFAGGKGRDYLAGQFALEMCRIKKRVVISHLNSNLFPVSGQIVYNRDQKSLLKEIEDKIRIEPVIYAGMDMNDHFVKGINIDTAMSIISSETVDYLIMIIGSSEPYSVISNKNISNLKKISFFEQLIYCFQIDQIDQPDSVSQIENTEEFSGQFPAFKRSGKLNSNLMTAYLIDSQKGLYPIFEESTPTVLVLTDITNLFLENAAINFTRNLPDQKFKHLFLANLKENLVTNVSPK